MQGNKERPSKSDSVTDIKNARRVKPAENEAPDTARTLGGWMIALLWIIALGAATYAAQGWFEARDERRNGVIVGEDGREQALLLSSNRFGHYRAKGLVNGEEMLFLLDTGATGISIPAEIADKLNLSRGRASQAITANGTITVYATRLDTLRIGPFLQRNVQAHINPSMEGEMALLGMSFLRQYELSQRDGNLTISAPD